MSSAQGDMPPPPREAPSAAELLAHPVVQEALEEAWIDSLASDSKWRHEEGGWIYLHLQTGEIVIRRAPPGKDSLVILENPPIVYGAVIVGVFHTHPNPSSEGWVTEPSEWDRIADERDGVPDLIRADDGMHISGPERRRGGLAGNSGYPS